MIELEKAHLDWAADIARHLSATLPPSFDVDDLIQEAHIAVLHCTRHFDLSRGVPFKAYAFRRVKCAVLMCVRRRHYKNATMEAADETQHAQRTYAPADDVAASAQRRSILVRVLLELPERERAIVSASFLMDGVPMRLLARRMGVSISGAYALRQSGLLMMRQMMSREEVV